ncbi:interferon-induced GTP-binding Mx3-like protein [Labeo rohita]|uniref:Interferon-induced GTP-binding Mx3-like protein n=1 Tax=Labeo rohita TaxID=84645 RepID=A0A498MEK1_LABRO|nr:interferon-induced GTP-binding Mx3-like protein [Labeo rohita]RXN38608.1 interferon-induced GTP-binding Mx3-like protein [Labeo rohita]
MNGVVHSHVEQSIRPYIDLIDSLRSIGIQKDLALPTIAVIGDQSSGKSSVLEALSGVALPRGSGIVTRCPLELRLKKVTGGVNWKAVLSYRDKKKEFNDSSLVENYIEEAQNELAGKGVGICDELIILEIMSPDVCDLTLIDLPGIARVPVKGQPEDIEQQIKSLIRKYIEKQETINLVVVPCNTDIATTEALQMAQAVDPKGMRSVGILTKPDLIDKGTETKILDIALNKVIPLHKGYIMVKCRGQQQINDNISLEKAAQTERDFFQEHNYFRCLLNEDKATIKSLAVKLTQHLVDHIKKTLPQLNEQIKKQLWEVRNELKECEDGPPQDPKGAKQFLTQTLTGFIDQIKSKSSGELIVKDNLFVQLREKYEQWNNDLNETKISFYKLTEEKLRDSQSYRGRELLGFSNDRVFEDILQKQVATLKNPAVDLLNAIKDIIIKQFNDVVNQCFKNYPVLRAITLDKIQNIQSVQQEKAEQRISEQFDMENMIFTQDPIYLKSLNEITAEEFSKDQSPFVNKKCTYSDMLKAYYEIVVQQMSDQLPMMTTLFMLKQTTQLMSIDMLNLLDGANVKELLSEDSDDGRKRRDLHARLEPQNELAGKGVRICDELITLEVMSPDACDLTLIDLPGIARVPVKGQPEDIGDQTINMVVVPCNTDIATTEALKMAQVVDPEGKRTVAILTKPDLIDKGTEKSILEVVHNNVIGLRKGYIMVKCRGQQQIDDKIPLEEAAEMEEDFFQNHDYFRGLLTENKATVRCLAVKLTQNLVDHIKKSLPQLDEEIKKQLWDVRNELKEFEGGPPQDPKGAKQFLIKNKINNIQSSQQAKAEQRILEQFEMENMIYTQDPIYLKFLNEISDETFTEDHLPIFDIKSKYSEMMQAYYKIVVQRMADQPPMMISFFMLKETAQLLSIDMLSLLDGANVSQLLLEDSEVVRESVKQMTENYDEAHRGRELVTFSDYCVYESMVKKHVGDLKQPALDTLKLIRGIVQKEFRVMCELCFPNYPHLRHIILIVYQRLADYIPMVILLFILKKAAVMLRAHAMDLRDGADVVKLLVEDTEAGQKRADLHQRMEKLRLAQECISIYL